MFRARCVPWPRDGAAGSGRQRSSRLTRVGTAALLVVGMIAAALPAGAQTMGTLIHDERLEVRGLSQVDAEPLARALVNDDSLLLLSRPHAYRDPFLSAVGQRAVAALQHDGFATAQATASVESSGAGERVVVDVVEGPRQLAAGIEITGLPDDLAEGLHRWLQSQCPPPGAVPQTVDLQGGWTGVRWLDPTGLPARMEIPAWTQGQPAPFDPPHLATVRIAIGRFLRDRGYFAAAKLLEEHNKSAGRSARSAAASAPAVPPPVDLAVRPGPDGAVLVIAFRELPPPAVLAGCEVLPGCRTTAADLQQTLSIVPGSVVTEQDRLAWREALRQSGRFLRHEVKLREVPPAEGTGGGADVVAEFDLDEYSDVTPLVQPLSREEQTMLRCREWLLKTLADDNDLIVSWTAADAPATAAPLGALVLSTWQGALLTALPASPEACGVAVSGDGVGWFLPQGSGWFEMPMPTQRRVMVNVAIFLKESIDQGRHSYRPALAFSHALELRPRDATAALAVTARIEPVAVVALVHEGHPTLSWEGDELILTRPDLSARFDSRSGRLLSMQVPQHGRMAVDAAPGRFAADLAALRAAAGPSRTRPEALVSSGVEFFAGESMGESLGRMVEAFGVAPTVAVWRERLEAVAGSLRRTAEAGGFAAADKALATAMDRADQEAWAPTLAIPREEKPLQDTDPTKALYRTLVAKLWRWTERECGREEWPASLARVGAYAVSRDPVALIELASYTNSKRHGPVAYLAAASVTPMPSMAVSLARHGQERLNVEAFHADCQPVLAMLASCGADRCAVSLLRTLHDDEAILAGQKLLQNPNIFLPLMRDLRSRESDAAATAALPEILDHWWAATLHEAVAAGLSARIGLLTADKPATDAAPVR